VEAYPVANQPSDRVFCFLDRLRWRPFHRSLIKFSGIQTRKDYPMAQTLIVTPPACQLPAVLNFPETPVDDDCDVRWSSIMRIEPRCDQWYCVVLASDGATQACFVNTAPLNTDPNRLRDEMEMEASQWRQHLRRPPQRPTARANLPPHRLDRRLPEPPARRRTA
jgi:hypothetical protein